MLNYLILVALFGVVISFYVLQHLELRAAKKELDKERVQHSISRERLFAAWKDGYSIPAPPTPVVEPEEDAALPDVLAPIWEQWEGPGQAPMKRVLRDAIASGRTVDSILAEYGYAPPQPE